MQAEKHASRVAVKDREAGHNLADVISRNSITVLLAVVTQKPNSGDFVIIIVQIQTGIHAAVHELKRVFIALGVAAGEDEDLFRG